jgi:hypothetical protein
MQTERLKRIAATFFKKWWVSLLILPFIIYSIHQIYWSLRFNIFFSVNYSYPFPLNIIHLFVDTFLLITHEAGHTFFSIFGVRFITILGGSLFQILLPIAILLFCWINRKSIGVQLSFCLLGYSWMDVAGYAADASERQLPLIGNLGEEAHDWYNLLIQLDALQYDRTIAFTFVAIGIICYIAALMVPLFFKTYKEVSIDLNIN